VQQTANPFAQVWSYRGLIGNFASRELKGQYKGSALGSLWSLVNPLASLAIYSLVFGFFLRFPPRVSGNGELASFPLFLFTALVVWNFFHAVTTRSMGALIGAGPLLRKIYFPPFAPVLGSAIAVLNQTAIEFGLLLIVLAILGNVSWTWLLLPVLLVLLAGFALGIGLFLSMLNARYRDVNHIVTVVLSFFFYTAPIVYPISMVQEKYDAHPWLEIYEWNPLTVFVESFRNILWDLEFPGWGNMGYMLAWSAVVLIVGWTFFQRRARDVSEEL
jgi:ABC-type polysaccharide/polyol phosphate export permease